jgi:peptidoglycan/LPS O-acetylase OafA/YrhL
MTLQQPHLSHPKYRPDIDGLRAIAVLAVVAFHAFPSWIRGGFIGVDVFFVISGYLISTIIFENLDKGTFSFAEFYSRRIKRIFPALILVLVACFVFGWFTLLADEYKQLGKHIAAGAGFVSNIVFWNEAGYFDNAADTKPLLHLWSLGIEEQFYIVWPLLLWFAWRRKFNLLTITILVATVSFILNIKEIKHDAVATFYSPQTRFWELLSGSLLAWMTLYKKDASTSIKNKIDGYLASIVYREKQNADGKTLSNFLSLVGLLLLAYGFWRINKELSFPGKWALVPVLGAIFIISAGSKAWVNRAILSNKVAVWFGLISFSLYLWHWPLLSFARIIENEVPSRSIRIAAVVLSIVLAWLTYKIVERPIRVGKVVMSKSVGIFLISITAVLGYSSYKTNGFLFYRFNASDLSIVKAFLPKYSLEYTSKRFSDLSNKSFDDNGLRVKIVIIGDSYAQDLVNAIYETGLNQRFQIVTRHIRKECGNLYLDQSVFVNQIPPNLLSECQKVRIYEDLSLKKMLVEADEVWFASSWLMWHVNYISNSVKSVIQLTNRPVRVFGRKNFGKIYPRELLKLDKNHRPLYVNKVPEEQIRVNERMKSILPTEVFVNVQYLLCGAILVTCSPFTNKGLLKSYDGTHLTQDGALLYGLGLSQSQVIKDGPR